MKQLFFIFKKSFSLIALMTMCFGFSSCAFMGDLAQGMAQGMGNFGGYGTGGYQVYPGGFVRDTSMDYLLDPRYAMHQVLNEEQQEYQAAKRIRPNLTLEQFRLEKGQAIQMAKSGGSSSSTSTSSSTRSSYSSSSSKSCPQCNGTGRMEYNTNPPQFGLDNAYKVKCSECGKEVLKSWGHSHITCKICHGKGTI